MVDCFLGTDGETIRGKPKKLSCNKQLNNRQIVFFRLFTDFLMNSKYLNNRTQLYIRFKNFKIVNVAELFNMNEEQLNEEGIKESIRTDRHRIVRDFGENVISDIMENKDIEKYEEKLHNKIIKYSGINKLDISFRLPIAPINTHLPDKDFLNCVSKLLPYSKKGLQDTVSKLSSEQVGYLEFLVSCKILTEQDKERKELLFKYFGREHEKNLINRDNDVEPDWHLPESMIKRNYFK